MMTFPVVITLERWSGDYACPIDKVHLDLADLLPAYDKAGRENLATAIFEESDEEDQIFYIAESMGFVDHDGPFTVDLSNLRSNLEDEEWWDEEDEEKTSRMIVETFNTETPLVRKGLLTGAIQGGPVTPEVFYESAVDGIVKTAISVSGNTLVGMGFKETERNLLETVVSGPVEYKKLEYTVSNAKTNPPVSVTVLLTFEV